MLNRRQILVGAAAACAVPAVAGAVQVGVTGLAAAIYDDRFGDAVTFAVEAQRLGVPVLAIDGDVTALWRDLGAAWRREPMAIAGATTPSSLFCLQLLAHDRGHRLVMREALSLEASPARLAAAAASFAVDGGRALPLAPAETERSGLVAWAIVPRRRSGVGFV
jgi:hypothetical protein